MNLKFISFILVGIGILLIFIATPQIINKIPFLSGLSAKYIVLPGIIMVGMGIILMMSSSEGKKHAFHHKTKMGEEVPIFHNKEIIGYRITK